MANNDLLTAVALLERVLPLLKENTRDSIRKDTFNSVQRNLDMCMGKICQYTDDVSILMPLAEMIKLKESLCEDADFVECSADVKKTFVDKTYMALNALYRFTGEYYMDHDFDYSDGMKLLLIRIIESCITQGFYFGTESKFTGGDTYEHN